MAYPVIYAVIYRIVPYNFVYFDFLKLQKMIDKGAEELISDFALAREATGLEEEDVGLETSVEDREMGTVSYRTYRAFLTAGNTIPFLVFVTIAFFLPDSKLHKVFTDRDK